MKSLGKQAEDWAAAYLQERGYDIRERNYRCPLGEIDLVALDGDVLVFVEVKSRSSTAFGHPEESITPAKQRKLLQLAAYYLKEKGLTEHPCRFDVAALLVDSRKERVCSIRLITDAF